MAGPNLPDQGSASLTDILTSIKDLVIATNNIVDGVGSLSPHSTSGQVIGAKLVQTGFVRLLGISVVSAATLNGLLCDAATLATATSATVVGNVSAAIGYYPVNMIFQNGLVYIPGSAQVAALFFART
jgi:hypothetical protein